MNDDRNYILDRLRSRSISIDEFNFDNLKAPPLGMFLSQWDIRELYNIATSLKLSAKPDIRYKMIDEVMRRRGLVKFLSGTNRVTYRHPEFPNILFKVASDAVGMKDNPAEFYNQHLLKPFVTKIFEISPCGTVAITERVNPITSREEFISVADDIFELITGWLVGEYVLADFGSTFFMNYGIRKGFGCVLLDYPYLYKLDGNKLYCNKPDHTSPSGKCDGIIDYDSGYNFLHCTKCGAVYKAKELEVKIKNNEIINVDEGEKKMEIIIRGGSKAIKETNIRTMDSDNPAFAESMVSVSHLGEKMENAIQKAVSEASERTVVDMSNIDTDSNDAFEVVTNKKSNDKQISNKESGKIVRSKSIPNEPKKSIIPTAPIVKESPVDVQIVKATESVPASEDKKLSVNGVNSQAKVAESPIEMSEDIKAEARRKVENESCDREPSPVETIERSINIISRRMNEVEIDVVRDDLTERLFLAVTSMLPNNNKSFEWLISAAKDIIDADIKENTISAESLCDMESIVDFVGKTIVDKSDIEGIDNLTNDLAAAERKVESVTDSFNQLLAEKENAQKLLKNAHSEIEALQKSVASEEELKNNLLDENKNLKERIKELENLSKDDDCEESTPVVQDVKFTSDNIVGIKSFGAVTTDLAELLPTQTESQKLIALVDEDGKYVCVNNLMLVVDEVDGQLMNDMEIVSAEYINDLNNALEVYMSNSGSIVDDGIAESAAQYDESEYPVEDDGTAASTNDAIDLATQRFLEDEEKVEV